MEVGETLSIGAVDRVLPSYDMVQQPKNVLFSLRKERGQAGAELCQAQGKLKLVWL